MAWGKWRHSQVDSRAGGLAVTVIMRPRRSGAPVRRRFGLTARTRRWPHLLDEQVDAAEHQQEEAREAGEVKIPLSPEHQNFVQQLLADVAAPLVSVLALEPQHLARGEEPRGNHQRKEVQARLDGRLQRLGPRDGPEDWAEEAVWPWRYKQQQRPHFHTERPEDGLH
eukprot:scaffold4119_cov118-Isochrysis_galbana.AAC.1